MTARKLDQEQKLEAELKALPDLPRSELQKRWVELYETPCPVRISRKLLTYALAYRMQEKVYGGLDKITLRKLEKAKAALAAGRPLAPAEPKIKPGTRFVREWHGTLHEVTVVERGVQYRKKTWPSLSAVAREITGVRWSGPRFFGLKKGA